jgi:integrase
MVKRNYIGKNTRQTTEDLYRSIDESVKSANERLGKCRLKIDRKSGRLFLRGTLPPLPNEETSEKTKRYWVPFCDATLKGVIDAEIKCKDIDTYLKLGNSDWWLLMPDYQQERTEKLKPKTMDRIKLEFEQAYWLNRKRERKTLNTWEKSYQDIFLKIPDEDLFTEKNIVKWLEATEANSKPRQDLLRVIKALADYQGIKESIDWKKYPCKYKPKRRTLPTDEEIEFIYQGINDEAVKWSFGLCATYGLRPSEMFLLKPENIKAFIDPSNTRKVLQVPDDTKTGEREVYPLHPKWIEDFDLMNVCLLKTKAEKLETKVSWLNKLFRKFGFNHGAYDLRHRYAIRASELGVLVDIAAKWMGHSVEEHCKTYQKWMDKSTHNKAFDKVIKDDQKVSEVNRLRFENQWLKDEINRLKEEIECLKLKSK